MLLDGVPLGNKYREARLVNAYYDRVEANFLKTKALLYASLGMAAEASSAFNKYGKAIFPTSKKYNEEMAERNRDVLERQAHLTLFVEAKEEE